MSEFRLKVIFMNQPRLSFCNLFQKIYKDICKVTQMYNKYLTHHDAVSPSEKMSGGKSGDH